MIKYYLGHNCCNQVMKETLQHWQNYPFDSVELWSERVCQWLSKISASHKHQPKGFRITTSRLIRGLVNHFEKKDSVTVNETFSDTQGQSKIDCFLLLRAPIHFPHGQENTQCFDGKSGNKEWGLKLLKS